MVHRVALSLLLFIAGLGFMACANSQGPANPKEAKPGDTFIVTRDTAFYDSGCAQARPNDGKLEKGTRFTLVGISGNCWNVKLGDEDEVYIQPEHVTPAG